MLVHTVNDADFRALENLSWLLYCPRVMNSPGQDIFSIMACREYVTQMVIKHRVAGFLIEEDFEGLSIPEQERERIREINRSTSYIPQNNNA